MKTFSWFFKDWNETKQLRARHNLKLTMHLELTMCYNLKVDMMKYLPTKKIGFANIDERWGAFTLTKKGERTRIVKEREIHVGEVKWVLKLNQVCRWSM